MNRTEPGSAAFSPFWPLCLTASSLVILFGWQLTVSVQQYLGSLRMVEQQALVASQAAQTESKLQAMMTDLLLLAKTDSEAQAIITKYRIKMNADKPAAAAPAPAAAAPAPAAAAPAKAE